MSFADFNHLIFGERHRFGEQLPLAQAQRIFSDETLSAHSRQFMAVPIDTILRLLERTGDVLCDPSGALYQRAMALLPPHVGFSPAMVAYGLAAFRSSTTRQALSAVLRQIGPNRHCLDHFINLRGGRPQRAIPLGSICHIAAGNIFLGSVGSLIQGIITKNVNILKISSQDTLFPSLFIEALEQADPERQILSHQCITYWKQDNHDIEKLVKASCDGILLFGGEESVLRYKNGLSAKAETLAFGPKLSFGLVLQGQSEEYLRAAATGFARDIVLWEQRACTSCQNIFVEDHPTTAHFGDYLLEALEAEASHFPPPPLELDTAIELRKEWELQKWREFNNAATLLEGRQAGHSIIIQRSNELSDSPLHRTVYVNLVDDWRDVFSGNLDKMRYYLSTVAIAGEENLQTVAEAFIQNGMPRIVTPGMMSSGRDPQAPHDGRMMVPELVRLVSNEGLPWSCFGLENLPAEHKAPLLLARLNDLLLTARKAPFYREHHRDVALPLPSLDALTSVPVLEKQHLFKCSADENLEMATGPAEACYLFASGGTTSRPKYLLYSVEEFEESKRVFGEGLRAPGINRRDVVVNYLKAGGLYTGFLAVNAGLEETGCRIIPMSCNQDEDASLDYIDAFRPNTLIAFPSAMIRLAQAAERSGRRFTFEKLFYAGEYISPADIDYVKSIFKPRQFGSFGYAAVETGPIGYQCPHCVGTEHHVAEDWCRVELSEDKEVLVTVLGRTLFPVVRYNVGDLAEWVDEPCGCGRTSPKLRLLDRSAKCIVLPASSISFQDIGNVTATIPGLTSIYQAVVTDAENGDVNIVLKVECRSSAEATRADLREELEQSCRRHIHALRDCWEANRIGEFSVELLAPGGIESNQRTAKTKRVLDMRRPSP
jgi:phenylacetate-coenzyme A ligase PaaK-like adenylate-forming protein